MDSIKDWLVVVISGLVENPKAVEVTVQEDEEGILFICRVGQGDMARVIGRGGSNANSIRTLLRVMAFLKDVRASLKIVD